MSIHKRSRELAVLIAVGSLATLVAGTAVAASKASPAASSAVACVTKAKTLSLLKSGKCGAHSKKVTIGAQGMPGAQGIQGIAGPKGDTGAAGAAGVGPAYSATGGVQINSGYATVATLPALPAGQYVVTAEGYVNMDGTGQVVNEQVNCYIYKSATDNTAIGYTYAAGAVGESLSLGGTLTVAASTTAAPIVSCGNSDTRPEMDSLMSIQAIRVSSIN